MDEKFKIVILVGWGVCSGDFGDWDYIGDSSENKIYFIWGFKVFSCGGVYKVVYEK